MPDSAFPTVHFISERAIALHFEQVISAGNLSRINALNQQIKAQPFAGFITTVPAYATLTVFFDPLMVMQANLPGADSFDKVSHYLTELLKQNAGTPTITSHKINIPVCYDETLGPDLAEVAQHNQLSTADVIKLHSGAVYKVFMIGFIPGFAYLGGMDAQLATPRKSTPRKAVPAGAIGIAGAQTGIYPLQTPGGWQIIGQTPISLFDAARAQPSLLSAGDEVVFKPIDLQTFNHLRSGHAVKHY